MIPRDHVIAWRQIAPWPADAQVEQDLVLSRALVEMFHHPAIAAALAFRGGTALHKLVLSPPARYSEDIDLVQINPGAIGPILTAMREVLDSWLGSPQRKQSQGRVTLTYRFESSTLPIEPLRLKIEVNTREHFSVLGFDKASLSVSNPWFSGKAAITTYRAEELLGTKLRALYQRKKGRDLFDLAAGLDGLPGLDEGQLIVCFERYLSHSGLAVSRAEFEENLLAKLMEPEFTADLPLILATESLERFNVELAGRAVLDRLVARLRGQPWRKPRERET